MLYKTSYTIIRDSVMLNQLKTLARSTRLNLINKTLNTNTLPIDNQILIINQLKWLILYNFRFLPWQAIGLDSWVQSALKRFWGGPYFRIGCMIFRYYPQIHFYIHFWNQNWRKNSLAPKKFNFRRPIFNNHHIFNWSKDSFIYTVYYRILKVEKILN